MSGPATTQAPGAPAGGTQAPAVDVRDLTVKFGDFTAVDKVTFQVAKGEIFGFLGANGAGKTTTIRVLCGLLKPTSGEIHVGGESFHDDNQGLKSKSGYMSQKFTLYGDMTVAENMEFKAALRGVSAADLKVRKEKLFRLIGYDHPEKEMVRSLPGGLKQQVSLAAALLHEPEIIFLDEPTAGVSPEARVRFWDIIRDLAKGGQTVFVTTHYMDEAEQCGRIALMRDGKLVALDSPAGLKKQTFPFGLIELEETGALPADWMATLRARKGVASLKPHGRRWHLEPDSQQAAQELRSSPPAGTTAKDF
ncbi:MAG TPA: ABC transporter ATP-binding protein, partial [bacterium]|nr:ABC transporter ATP-binding protein [bacterium]